MRNKRKKFYIIRQNKVKYNRIIGKTGFKTLCFPELIRFGGNIMNKKISEIDHIKSILKKSQHTIRKKFKAEITGIFGSYIRGEQKEDSDLDILVKFYKGASLFELAGLKNYLEEKLDVKVDIVSDRAVRQEIKEEIYREVVHL
ncbi:MAG: nucleotidyltransferase family protein [Elusimicrobiota bacterium]